MARTFSSVRVFSWADRFRCARRGAVSVMFAAGAIPMIGLVGVAVDFGIWNQTNSALSVAANVAAISAVRIAANAQVGNDGSASNEGVESGDQWFASEAGLNATVGTEGVSKLTSDGTACSGTSGTFTCVTMGPTVTARVSYSGTVPSVFGLALFGLQSYQISGSATAVVTTAPFLNVEMMLDNSASMQIGATNSDISALQTMTPCNQVPTLPNSRAPGAFYPTGPLSNVYNSGNLQNQGYGNYVVNGYTGGAQNPVVVPPGITAYSTFPIQNQNNGPSCVNQLKPFLDAAYTPPTALPPLAGPPCAFACHFDPAPAGTGNDFYGLARSTNGSANPIVLRFDLVKQATNAVINAMQADNISQINNLNVGIYWFATSTTRAYPDPSCGSGLPCEAGGAWATALSDVGGRSQIPNDADTGIQPTYTPTNLSGGDTNFHQDMVSLQGMLTPSGDGTKATTPRKVLFLVTDGMSDTSVNRAYSPVSSADCALFKSMGYTVYVVFTPYYPVMNLFYIGNIKPFSEPLVGSQVYNAMQACASTPGDFISASDGATLTAALQTFLKQALNSPARFTQ